MTHCYRPSADVIITKNGNRFPGNTAQKEARMVKIDVQAMMLKENFAQAGPLETLRQVSEIGYHAVEISQIPMTKESVAELGRARTECT
jgi:hypothetical protein